jgi:hypothetical protein
MKHAKRFYLIALLFLGLGMMGMMSRHEMNARIRTETDKAIYESCKRDPSVNCPPTKELLDAAYVKFYAEVKQALESQ